MPGVCHVLVVGSINVDITVSAERLPGPGETVAGGRLERAGGGKGANQAVAAARAGGNVMLVGAVGDDDLGADALAALDAEGIDIGAVRRLPDAATGVALIVVDRAGDNQIAVASGANHALDAAQVRSALEGLGGDGSVLVSFELTDTIVLARPSSPSHRWRAAPRPGRSPSSAGDGRRRRRGGACRAPRSRTRTTPGRG